ncbi:MAG TPA: histidinol-phosphate transaminase [Anaerolineaceae bacterium]|nr:histidinol-phosphate transaminase [Anaerolineaceae bacterium]
MKPAVRFERFPPYTPIEPFEVLSERLGLPVEKIIKLDANENPYGMSPRARAALADLDFPHIYPDPESRTLRRALAEFTGLPVDSLMAGAGADELIDLILRVMLEKDEGVLNFPPTFGMYPFDTYLNAGQVISIPRRADFSLDLPAIRTAVDTYRPRILFVTAPNNPDGNLPDSQVIQEILDLPVLVVVDEAYIEFCEGAGRLGEQRTLLPEVLKRENLVVLRTFSKWAGLAGLRVGYGAFPAWLMPVLWKAKQPYNVNVAATAAAIASLQDREYLAENVARLRIERNRLYEKLRAVPFLEPFPSQANFILCRVNGTSALSLKEALAQRGILVRFYNTPLLQNYIRISVGKPPHTNAVIEAMQKLAIEWRLS